jgi:uncharacterized protein YcbK (DUF882 family)
MAARKKKTTAESMLNSISAFGEMVQKEAKALADSVAENFKRNYRRRAAKRKPAARTSVKRATASPRKVAVRAPTRSRLPQSD